MRAAAVIVFRLARPHSTERRDSRMLNLISLLPRLSGARALAALAAVLAVTGLTSPQSRAQSDGSYPSDSRGGYSDNDDEDGYEDGQDAPDVSYFYDELEDEGEWISDSNYGQVWRPRRVDADWRPYTRGTWANTKEHGWYWVSDEPFGWATYHYGRWHLSDRYGWVWVPGTRWGPAWVTWRSNDDHIGWAPLPPEAYWEHGSGLRFETRIYEEPRYEPYWSFVEFRYITSPRLYTYCAPRARVTTYIYSSRPAENYVFVNRRIVNRGVSVTRIETVTRTRITTVRVNASDNRTYRSVRRDNNVLNVYRPKLTRAAVINDRRANTKRPDIDRSTFRDVDKRQVRNVGAPRAGQPGANRASPIPTGIPGGGGAKPNGNDQSDRAVRLPGNGPQGDRPAGNPSRVQSGFEPNKGLRQPGAGPDVKRAPVLGSVPGKGGLDKFDKRGYGAGANRNSTGDLRNRSAPRNLYKGQPGQASQRNNGAGAGFVPNGQQGGQKAAQQRNKADGKGKKKRGDQE